MERRPIDVLVLSDIHLGTYGCKAAELVTYLKTVAPHLLVLNGDIIDCWQFSRRFFPAAHMRVIREILHLMTTGTRVFYITGNHDEVLRKYSDFHLNNFTLTDKLVLEIDQQMTWIFHGDVFDNTTKGSARFLAKLGSSGYGLLILFNRFINFLLTSVGKEKVSISKRIMSGVNRAVAKVNDLQAIATGIAIEKKYDFVICGHIHEPQIKEVVTESGKVTYLNSGDWVEHLTALEYANKSWTLFEYSKSNLEHSSDKETPSHLSVVSDQIDLYITSLVEH